MPFAGGAVFDAQAAISLKQYMLARATVALPPMAWLTGAPASVVYAAAGAGALILFRHRANARRLLAGTERRMGESIR
jgi:glycerol-3-phosphate acyltransferase PlsY